MSPILLMVQDTSVVTFTATVVIAGISIVIGVLLLLIFLFDIFGKIMPVIEKKVTENEKKRAARKAEKKAKKLAEKAACVKAEKSESPSDKETKPSQIVKPSAPAVSNAPAAEAGISGEVVAAIAAAVAASEGANAVVRSIKKKTVSGRNPWAYAANVDNTRPF